MVKSKLNDLGVFGLLVIWATTLILGVWGHVVEEVVENLDFTMAIHKNPVLLRGQKFKQMALEKTLFPCELPIGPKNYLQHPYFALDLVPVQI